MHNAIKCLSELFESALKNSDKWKDWTKAARTELRATLKSAGIGLHAHHILPLELLTNNKIINTHITQLDIKMLNAQLTSKN